MENEGITNELQNRPIHEALYSPDKVYSYGHSGLVTIDVRSEKLKCVGIIRLLCNFNNSVTHEHYCSFSSDSKKTLSKAKSRMTFVLNTELHSLFFIKKSEFYIKHPVVVFLSLSLNIRSENRSVI